MATTTTQRVELPAGYSVLDRLGAGGYGEVWKATAPGGLEKAVKIVFGHCDEGMAERELKSLERIKSVRHPFLLSIERYEIVNNRLVIVTELADMSLSDCFQDHVAAGRPGIPREQLIAYLWDAAEALDCLIDHHSLQHLDVKPENLLVVGDHIKVADFGLVKELASKTLHSVMGGMTPLYSAPEIYDNSPSPRSDQYSLAIVYQHMLTGTLPFSGRTPAQLAKQHTLAQPNVNPLIEADRSIVRKALEKDPQARFGSCREFIAALRSVGQDTAVRSAATTRPANPPQSPPISSDETKSISLVDTRHLRDPISVAATQRLGELEGAVEELSRLEIDRRPEPAFQAEFPVVNGQIIDVETPAFDPSIASSPVPTFFIGIGGVGIKLLKAIRSRVDAHDPHGQLALAWLAMDTERDTLKATCDEDDHSSLSAEDKLHIPLRRPNQYRDDSQDLLRWVSRRWLYNIPRSLQTRGYRPLGRIAIVDHADEVLTALQKRLHSLAAQAQNAAPEGPAIRVVVLAGMSGGTGGGTLLDVAQAVRSLCRDHSPEVTVQAVLGCTYHPESNDSLAATNMYALLTELTHAQTHGNHGENTPPGAASLYESSQRPFDSIYTVMMSGRLGRSDCGGTHQSVADYLLLDASGGLRAPIDAIRATEDASEFLRTFCCVNLGQLERDSSAKCQKELFTALIARWVEPGAATGDVDARLFHPHTNSQFASAVLAHCPEMAATINDATDEAEVEEQRSRRTATIKAMAKGFLKFLDAVEVPLDREQQFSDHPELVAASERILAAYCQLFQSRRLTDNEAAQQLSEILGSQVNDLAADSSGPDMTQIAEAALSLSAAGPLDCGFERRTLLVTPHDQNGSELTQACRDQCPTLTSHAGSVNDGYLIREGSGLNPLHLGAKLAELYPDIAEAAGRLHTRQDICWHDLRAIGSQTAIA